MCPPPPDGGDSATDGTARQPLNTHDLLEKRRRTTDPLGLTDVEFTLYIGVNMAQAHDGASPQAETQNAEIQLSDERNEPNPKDNVQQAVLTELEDICRRYDLPLGRAKRASRQLLQKDYVPGVKTPRVAPAIWSDREGAEKLLSPLEFLDKHWGTYIDEGVITQCQFREFDDPLYEAVRYFCKLQTPPLEPMDYLPPPARKQKAPNLRVSAKPAGGARNRKSESDPSTQRLPRRPPRRRAATHLVAPPTHR